MPLTHDTTTDEASAPSLPTCLPGCLMPATHDAFGRTLCSVHYYVWAVLADTGAA